MYPCRLFALKHLVDFQFLLRSWNVIIFSIHIRFKHTFEKVEKFHEFKPIKLAASSLCLKSAMDFNLQYSLVLSEIENLPNSPESVSINNAANAGN